MSTSLGVFRHEVARTGLPRKNLNEKTRGKTNLNFSESESFRILLPNPNPNPNLKTPSKIYLDHL